MFKPINQAIAALLMGVFILIISGCDVIGGLGNEELTQHQFSYKIYDENGELLKKVTQERIGGVEVERSLGLFGENFLPPWIVEGSGLDPDDLRQHEIWLHADKGTNEDVHTLRFGFPFMEQWKRGKYLLPEVSKEDWLELFKRMRENRQVHQYERYTIQNRLLIANSFEIREQMSSVGYYESVFATERSYGLRIDSTSYMYQSTGGYVELENITGDLLEGSFTVDVVGLPMKIIFFSDDLPEDPEFRMYHITGSFVTAYGDYDDLIR